MKTTLTAVLLATLCAAPAWAQDDDFGGMDDDDTTTTSDPQPLDPAPAPEPAPPPEPAPAPPPPTEPAPPMARSSADDGGDVNPEDHKVGIGTGYVFPTTLDATNTVSVRFRLGRLTLEPVVDFSFDRDSVDTGGSDSDTDTINIGFGSNLRYALMEARGIELVGLGGARFNYNIVNPDGDENSTKTTTFSVVWGLGLDYWVSDRWVISMAAFNPFFELSRQTQESLAADTTNSNVGVGLIFNPTVVGMVHLFF